MSRRRNLRRRAARARRCWWCQIDDRLRLYRERVCCLGCYWAGPNPWGPVDPDHHAAMLWYLR